MTVTRAEPAPAVERLREVPASFWCFLGALLYNVFAGQSARLGLPIGLDRVLFPAAFVLAFLDVRLPRPRLRLVHGLMAAFVCVAGLSAFWWGTLAQPDGFYALLDRVLLPFLLFACAPLFLGSALQRLLFLRGLTMLGAYLAVIAVAQTVGASALLWPRYIDAVPVAPDGDTFRAGGPFLSGEANGMALAMCAIAAFLLVRLDRGGWRATGLLIGVAATASSILSMTRAVWVGVALAAVLVIAVDRRLWRWIPAMLAASAAVLAVGAALLPGVVEAATERGGTARSLHDRANTNAAAVRLIEDEPLVGIGWGRFIDVGRDWVRQADTYPLTSVNIEVHNVVLSRAVELGIPAAALYAACLAAGPGLALVVAHRRQRTDPWYAAALAASVVWLVPAMTSPNPYPFPAFVAFTITGCLYARVVPRDEKPKGPSGLTDNAARGVRGAPRGPGPVTV